MFLAPNIFFRGETPEFLEFSASFEPDSDHVAKFRGDRPRDLGDVAALKNITSKTEARPELLFRAA